MYLLWVLFCVFQGLVTWLWEEVAPVYKHLLHRIVLQQKICSNPPAPICSEAGFKGKLEKCRPKVVWLSLASLSLFVCRNYYPSFLQNMMRLFHATFATFTNFTIKIPANSSSVNLLALDDFAAAGVEWPWPRWDSKQPWKPGAVPTGSGQVGWSRVVVSAEFGSARSAAWRDASENSFYCLWLGNGLGEERLHGKGRSMEDMVSVVWRVLGEIYNGSEGELQSCWPLGDKQSGFDMFWLIDFHCAFASVVQHDVKMLSYWNRCFTCSSFWSMPHCCHLSVTYLLFFLLQAEELYLRNLKGLEAHLHGRVW